MLKKLIGSERGSALLMAVVAIVFLLILGLAVTTLSMGTLKTNVADATTNDAYYAAEAGVSSAIEHIKHEVSSYYAAMLDADSSTYSALYDNFFTGVQSNAMATFREPAISGSATQTLFSLDGADPDEKTISITSTATTADGTKYVVKGNVHILRLDVKAGSWYPGDNAIHAGGTVNLGTSGGANVHDADALVGTSPVLANSWQLKLLGANLIIDPGSGDRISDPLSYPSYFNKAISNPDPYVTQDTVFNWSNMPAEPLAISTADGVNLAFENYSVVPSGVIRGRGNIKASSIGSFMADIYCDGNLLFESGNYYGDIYCRGNVEIRSGTFHGDIICGGNLKLVSGTLNGTVISGGKINVQSASSIGSMYAADELSISSASISGGIIYSSKKVTLGNFSSSAIYFSGGDIVFTGGSTITGMLIAKDNIYSTSNWFTVKYDQALIDSILNDPKNAFFFTGSGGSSNVTIDSSVIVSQSIAAVGRQ